MLFSICLMFQRFGSLAAAAPGMPAIIEATSGEVTTRGDLLARAVALAAGIREGELLPVQMPNSVDLVATILAVMRQRAIAMLIDRDAADAEVGRITAHFGRHPKLPQGARVIQLASGSTGRPRGIITTEENLLADSENICRSMGIGTGDVNFGAIPLSHSYGFSNLVTPLITQGTALVISNSYLPQTIIDFCNRYQCTILPGIPMIFDHLASTDRADGNFETVRVFISAVAPLPSSTSRRFRERFVSSIPSFYGCSECGGITYDREGAAVERGTVRRAMDGVTLSMRGGRLVVHSLAAASGYLHDASSFAAFEQGKFVTDDVVEMRDGEIALTGRVREPSTIPDTHDNPRES